MKKLILFSLIVLAVSFTGVAKTSLQRIEPMNWWVGMKNPNLQLLVYGENISATNLVINYPGVTLKKVHLVENPNYLFVDLVIAPETKPGKFIMEFKEGKKKISTYEYELKARNSKANIHQGFNSSDAIYLLMPDRFSNGNPKNDATLDTKEKPNRENPNGRHGGDLQGVINHLDYITATGFTALWLNPFLENNQETFSYHGYAISDFYKVDSRYGTNEQFVELVDLAHQKQLKIIMDMIFNHCGIEHWFIKDLPMKNWIHQHDSFTKSNFRAPVVSDPYASVSDKTKMLTGWFDINMPDFDQRNPFLATYLIQNTIWWVEYAGIDGIRVDTQPYPYKEFISEWAKAIMEQYPTLNIVGEAWLHQIPITAYFQGGANNKDGYNSHMNCVTDFPMYRALNSAFNEKEGWDDGMAKFYLLLAQDYLYADPQSLLIFADNHDLSRYYEAIGKDLSIFKMGMAYLLTTRGVPQIYYGTEVLMDGLEHQGHGFIRKDFPGGWNNDSINAFTQTGLSPDQIEAYQFVKRILNWRKGNEAIHIGKLTHFIPESGVYVTFRYTDEKAVIIILNNDGTNSKNLETARFKEALSGYKTGTEIISGKTFDNLETILVPAKSALIIELQK